jgi:hypothetical protein
MKTRALGTFLKVLFLRKSFFLQFFLNKSQLIVHLYRSLNSEREEESYVAGRDAIRLMKVLLHRKRRNINEDLIREDYDDQFRRRFKCCGFRQQLSQSDRANHHRLQSVRITLKRAKLHFLHSIFCFTSLVGCPWQSHHTP